MTIDTTKRAHAEAFTRAAPHAVVRLVLGLDGGTIGRARLEEAARVMGWPDVPAPTWGVPWRESEEIARARLAKAIESTLKTRAAKGCT